MNRTLYEALGTPGIGLGRDIGRTERTAAIETIDKDRMIVDLYAALGDPGFGTQQNNGRTEETKGTGETVDRDRAAETLMSSLLDAPNDLYASLAEAPGSRAGSLADTALTASTETIDYDQPPDLLSS